MPFSRGRSLAVKIPLLLSLLLLAALAAMTVASYVELRRATVDIATARLQQAANQTANVFAMSTRQRVAAMKQLMQLPEIADYLRSGDASRKPAIEAAVKAYLGPAIEFADVELWDVNGKRLFAVGDTFEEAVPPLLDAYKKDLQLLDDAAIGHLRNFDDGLRYRVGGRVTHDGLPIGYVVERRRISNPAQTRQTITLLTGLIGNQATMLIGNADGTAWSNLVTTIEDLPINGAESRLWDYRRAGMSPTLAWATPIAGTPWAVAIEFPRAAILEPSQRFLLRSLAIAATLLLIAIVAGWASTRGITTALRHVTEGAEAVAESRSHVHIDMNREDEIGRLADAFNVMAEKVEQGRTDLEQRVEQRTAELLAANRELEAFSYSVSHDLRAPLRAIAGFVQILDEDHSDQLDDTAKRHLERVKVNARRMGQLIDDLLSFSQIGRSTMVRQTVDLTTMATSVAQEAIAASGRHDRIGGCDAAAVSGRIHAIEPGVREPDLERREVLRARRAARHRDRHDRGQRRAGVFRARQRRRLRRALRDEAVRRLSAPASRRRVRRHRGRPRDRAAHRSPTWRAGVG